MNHVRDTLPMFTIITSLIKVARDLEQDFALIWKSFVFHYRTLVLSYRKKYINTSVNIGWPEDLLKSSDIRTQHCE